jgi:hypothetical protein
MPRAVTAEALAAILADSTGEIFLATLKITGPGFVKRFVNDNIPLVAVNPEDSGEWEAFLAFPFEITFPTDDQDKMPIARIRVCNVTREIVDEIRALTETPEFEIAVRLASDPWYVQYGPWTMDGTSVSYDENYVEVDLRVRDFAVEPFPYIRMSPSRYPGLFR